MGWFDSHVRVFEIAGESYGGPATLDDVVDEERIALNKLLGSGITRVSYTYDFGGHWEHSIVIEKAEPAIAGQSYPVGIAGKRACPPEDLWRQLGLLRFARYSGGTNPSRARRTARIGRV